jgi:hypothetical protein
MGLRTDVLVDVVETMLSRTGRASRAYEKEC